MNKKQAVAENQKVQSNQANNTVQANKFHDISHSLTGIGKLAGVLFLILGGLGLGLFARLIYEPQVFNFRFAEGFVAALPFQPTIEVLPGMPPYSNRKMIKYETIMAPQKAFQILVLDSPGEELPQKEISELKLSAADAELNQVAESTIAVLCAEPDHSLRKNCLQPGSRLTRWRLVTGEGVSVEGSIRRGRNGVIIQLLAFGTVEAETSRFFESFNLE